MSLDIHRGALQPVKDALAAIPTQTIPPVSPIPADRLYYNRRPNDPPIPHAFMRSENAAVGRSALGVEFDAFLSFDAWARNREEIEAIRKAMLFLHGHSVGNQGTAYRIVYRLNSQNVITESDSLHLSLIFSANYLESGAA